MILMSVTLVLITNRFVAAQYGFPNVTRVDAILYRHDFPPKSYNLVKVGKRGYVMHEKYLRQGKFFLNFVTRPDDVYLVSYPGAGNIWAANLAWLIYNGLNYKAVNTSRIPFLEGSMLLPDVEIKRSPLDLLRSPRLIRTNLPFSLIPSIFNTAKKIIYIGRNPKDTFLSDFKAARSNIYIRFTGNIQRYWFYYANDLTLYSPYWEHLSEGYNERRNPRVLFLFIEENLRTMIRRIFLFLQKPFTDATVNALASYMDRAMRIRTGEWRNEFSYDLISKLDIWIGERRRDIKFPKY